MKSVKEKKRTWEIQFVSEVPLTKTINAAWFNTLAKTVLSHSSFVTLAPQFEQVSIRVVDDETIHRLNRDYRKKDKPTDVLSFGTDDGVVVSPSLGDLVISIETAKRQAKRFGVTLKRELTRLVAHGLLHLAGYDHEKVSAAKAQKMRRAEQSIMRMLS